LPTFSTRSHTASDPERTGRFIEAVRLVPPGGGYRERDARFSTLDPARAHVDLMVRRERFRELMHEREMEIDLGLEHLTPAAEEIKHKRGLL
jgi:hypothetical protein